MADLYPPYTRPFPPHQDEHDNEHDHQSKDSSPPKNESKPQATFLTKLYALLERPENHHMIRWDPQGEHIIVERPEQLALHVLPSIYRQSRFASFSRQLNIYGFMRKVNLRNVDPAIDDPDASTWSHPTLNRHSPPEVVANFKRRVPPRLPKPRKRDVQEQQIIPPPRSAIGVGPGSVPLTVPSMPPKIPGHVGRARGFSAPGSFTPLSQGGSAGWGPSYPRSALPPLTVPSEPHHMTHAGYGSPADDSPTNSFSYSQYSYPDSSTSHWSFSPSASSSHNGSLSSLLNPSSNNSSAAVYSSRPTPTINTSVHSSSGYNSPYSSMPLHPSDGAHSASSLSPDGHSRPPTGYSMSSVSSMSYDDYGSSSRPGSGHRQISTSPRPQSSSKSPYHSTSNSSLIIRRGRRHSQAMSPYPSPYDHAGGSSSSGSLTEHQRPSTSPQPDIHHGHHSTHHGGHHSHHSDHPGPSHGLGSLPRVRSMIQLPSVDTSASGTSPYSYNPNAQAEFAYSPLPSAASASSVSVPSLASVPSSSSISSMSSMHSHHSHHDTYGPSRSSAHGGRPGTAASSMSVASGSSQANTPPMDGGAGAYDVGISGGGVGVNDASMVRGYEPDFGFVAMGDHEHLQAGYGAKDM